MIRDSTGTGTGTVPGRNIVASVRFGPVSEHFFVQALDRVKHFR